MVKVYYRVMNLILTNILSVAIGFILGGCCVTAINEKNAKKQNKEKTKKTDVDAKEEDSTYKRTGTMGFYIIDT